MKTPHIARKLFFLFLLVQQFSFSQDNSITLDSCIVWAKRNYALLKQQNLISSNSDLNLKVINENWLPQLSFMAKANYQSEVVTFPGLNVNFPHDSYLASVSLNQNLFDGGQSKKQKEIESLNSSLDIQKNEIELYKIIDQVNQLYTNILLSRENLNVLNIYVDNINNRITNLKVARENNLVLESSQEEFEAELLETQQSIIEAKENLKAVYKTLEFFIHKPVNENTVLKVTPIGGATDNKEIKSPEMKLFEIQTALMDSKYDLLTKNALPKVNLYADLNYGRPGPNFLNQNLRSFANAGISIKWNITSLYGLSREKERLSISQKTVDVQKELFLFNLNNALTSQSAQIQAIREIIEKDKTIIEKRHNVTLTASAQMDNGSIKVSDYLTQLNAELQARLNQKIHEVRLMNAMTNYNTTKGVTNF